jgi:hypothetical protein
MSDLLAQRIEEVLRPVVGTVLATVSVELEAKRLGKHPESLTRFDLPVLADNLALQLRLVVGDSLAQAAAQRVRELV